MSKIKEVILQVQAAVQASCHLDYTQSISSGDPRVSAQPDLMSSTIIVISRRDRTQKSNDATVQFCWRPAAALTQRPESQWCVMMDALGGTKEPG